IAHGLHHPLIHSMNRFMNTWRIEEGNLPFRTSNDSSDHVTRGLGFICDDRYFFTNEAVQEGRFSGVRAADDWNESRLTHEFPDRVFSISGVAHAVGRRPAPRSQLLRVQSSLQLKVISRTALQRRRRPSCSRY